MTRNRLLLDFLAAHLPSGWLQTGDGPFERSRFLARFASATRRLSSAPLLSAQELTSVPGEECRLVGATTADEAGRIALLLDANERLSAGEMYELAEDSYRHGDNGEKRAVLRCLSLLCEPERYQGLAATACRTHVQTVFEALACENPFPARVMPDAAFNQLVLKAIFLGVELSRIEALSSRRTAELARMAEAFASERRAAGRSVPSDIALLRI